MTASEVKGLQDSLIWYDFFSIPQEASYIILRKGSLQNGVGENDRTNMLKAIASIPAYVEHSDLFIVVCPSIQHLSTGKICDYRSWQTRGWCRAEMQCRALSARPDSCDMIVVRSAMRVCYSWSQWVVSPVGEGVFTVDADRSAVGLMMKRALQKKLASCSGDTPDQRVSFKFLTAKAPFFLRGLLHVDE